MEAKPAKEPSEPLAIGGNPFFKSLRAIDLSQKELPTFVSEIEGLIRPKPSYRSVYFRWNRGDTVRISLNTRLLGKISLGVVARTRTKYRGSILLTVGQSTRIFGPNSGRLPAFRFTFDCTTPVTVIQFESPGGPRTFAMAYISIQQDD